MSQGDFKNLTQQHPVLFKESVRLQVGSSDLLGASPQVIFSAHQCLSSEMEPNPGIPWSLPALPLTFAV